MVIRKHIVKVTYLDYGSHLDTVWKLATSVDGGRPVSDTGEFPTQGQAMAARDSWLEEHVDLPAGFRLEAGSPIERRCDMNPQGLI